MWGGVTCSAEEPEEAGNRKKMTDQKNWVENKQWLDALKKNQDDHTP